MSGKTRRLMGGCRGRRPTRRTRPRTRIRIATRPGVRVATDDRRDIGVLGVERRAPGTAAPKLRMPATHASRAIVLAMAEGLTALRARTRPRGMPIDGFRITDIILMPRRTDALVGIRCFLNDVSAL